MNMKSTLLCGFIQWADWGLVFMSLIITVVSALMLKHIVLSPHYTKELRV